MIDRGEFVVQLLRKKSREELDQDRVLRSAVERELMVLGEALYQLHRVEPTVAEKIDDWRMIIGFRHKLVHGYDSLNTQIIWDTVLEDLPGLLVVVQQLLPPGNEPN